MQNNKLIKWLILAAVVIGFITGWFTKPAGSVTNIQTVKIHDTLKTTAVTYKILPGVNYNIDSLTNSINQFWKDSLKTLYGQGLFQSHYTKTDDLGTRTYTLDSRIPIDPESQLIVDESFIFPKKTLSLVAGIGYSASLGLKYYMLDTRHLSISGHISGDYEFVKKKWSPNAKLELEILY
ncbi:MAG: hypothetical protein P4L35_10695 [Ignavibacteriaceae bacterium]|nr:hypothetical protein [Ignavibacteriaceae bacterium]